ncbi:hypothetical protein TK35_12360 [Lacticaseibacillus paracasei]|uniref:hypothetical protein n=1 Tax=Lacticaseibacillus paracasei TaxID=1597 RepID=UPI001063FEF8
MINPFITWWVGEKYNLTFLTVVLIVANYAIQVYRNTGFAFIEYFGLTRISADAMVTHRLRFGQ